MDILRYRLSNQQLLQSKFSKPEEVVSWLGAVQSQDYPAATWALGLRLPGSIDKEIDQAFNDGKILRTHVMRPTWHFVAPQDIRWLLKLTAPRVHAISKYYFGKLDLDEKIFNKCITILTKILKNHNYLTRTEIATEFRKAGVQAVALRFAYIIIYAELEGIICSGPRKGKQFTYALLEERAPKAKVLDKDEALAELATRYFTSHGPATMKDFAWWSGLTVAEAKRGIELSKDKLVHEKIDDKSFWLSPDAKPAKEIEKTGYLLPNYDEYTIAYKDRSAFLDDSSAKGIDSRGNIIFNHSIIIGGKIVGGWRRTLHRNSVMLSWKAFKPLSFEEKRIVKKAAERYGEFLGMPVSL